MPSTHGHCACGETKLAETGFAFVDHRLHGAAACARQHTFGEMVRAVVDGCTNVQAVTESLGPEAHLELVGQGLSMLAEAGVVSIARSKVALSPGIATTADAEKKLAHGGVLHAGDLVT